MTREFVPSRLDVNGFAEAGAAISGDEPVRNFQRLHAELVEPSDDLTVQWKAEGERRRGADGAPVPWLNLSAHTRVPMVCQRCLAPVDVVLDVDRWFRFVADETIAAAEDEEAEEDVLVASREFDLHALIEDELLMEIPVTPRHEVCPEAARLSAVDPDFEASEDARPNPFAVLKQLKPDGDK
ncbi:uncharacterized protein VAR608DRAFT_6880 [Variovorax sp. HW608]|uniref:YceD family protein n=1 Tax=Variovorax sp. HW608 TaxID=1034889 RepID=UPI00081FD8CA|nr:DUF177 domain-containing protein [Variovorax sp. HW608]SCK60886.1 uncharacterized protein VAR608DRAFT_6880 [Variovorax sp. HW608]